MQVFVYEFVTGGGWYSCADEVPADSLLREGRAMLQALSSDFGAVAGTQVNVLHDRRCGPLELPGCTIHHVESTAAEQALFHLLAARADWTVVIAPEFSGFLEQRYAWVIEAGGRLLGPSPELVALTADKHRTGQHLARCGVRVPHARLLQAGTELPCDFRYPAVAKPRDGAGSLGVRFISSAAEPVEIADGAVRLEEFCPGLPASVAFLCGPLEQLPLPGCRQLLSEDGRFAYLGGSLPLEAPLAQRATRLAQAAVASLPSPLGYLGVDLVLGPASDGSEDAVIEINPRLTTSFVGLRAASEGNLAEAMLKVAQGGSVELFFRPEPLQFRADGRVFRRASGL